MKLLHFVSGILSDEGAQRAFAKDPDAAMDEAGLSEEQKELVRGRDRAQIGLAIAQEVALPGQIPAAPWPSSSIKINSISPTKGHRGTVVTMTVTGQWFTMNVSCDLLFGSHTIKGKVNSVTTGSSSSLTAKFVIAANAQLGQWDVKVANSPTDYDMLQNAFSIVA